MNYILFPKLGFIPRSLATIVFIFAGLSIQWSSGNFFAGVIFIILSGILHIQRGVALKRPEGGKKVWTPATIKELDKLEAHLKRLKKWRGIDFGSRLFIVVFPTFFLFALFPLLKKFSILLWDLIILFIPLFLTGNRSAWEPPGLRVKLKNLKDLIQSFPWKGYPDYTYQLQFGIRRKLSGSFPFDLRLLIRKKRQREDLIGIQGQYSINRVGNREYPYFYVVLLAKKRFGLKDKIRGVGDWTVEFESDKEVDVLIIRQHTTKTSGYHTPLPNQVLILKSGIETFGDLNG
ncbi:MAG TPA: hypothetical protein EYP24_02990 [bacterium (Candidatus Stahlbacteria)]|nr:hypothetical protein [Candidatus Stahlbacteria bacterium]